MARIGNWDVTLNKQGWFDITSANPLNGWFDKTAVGFASVDTNISPPGIPSAETQALPQVIQIVAAPGIPSAESVAPAFVVQIVEPPGVASAAVMGPAPVAIVITPAGIPSEEVVAAGTLAAGIAPPGIPSPQEVAAGVLAVNVEPPGIPSSEEVTAGELAASVGAPGIPSPSEVTAGELAARMEPPGIPSPEEVAPGDTTAGIHPPGIPSSEEDAPGTLQGVIDAPGIPANDVTAPGQVAPAPPVPAHGGPGGWWRQQKWDAIRAEANGWWLKTDIGKGPYQEVFAYGFPTDANDDNVYAIPLRSFEVAEDTSPEAMENLKLASLERAAGFDVISSTSQSRSVHPLVWVAAGAIAAFAIVKLTSKTATKRAPSAKRASSTKRVAAAPKRAPIATATKRVVKHKKSR